MLFSRRWSIAFFSFSTLLVKYSIGVTRKWFVHIMRGESDMDILQLSQHFNCDTNTMKKWITKGILPGVKQEDDQYTVSQYAMPPYTAKRAKNATAIRCAILKAALKHRSTCAKLFNIAPGIFDSYVKDLEDCGLIRVITDNDFQGDKFIVTTLKTDLYFKDKGFFGKCGQMCLPSRLSREAGM